ncbi:neutral/alkaline non-lysosomal ceramidase N-terminal domain-containing protein [bacterium]|nr:neutral/alkaline non-lysosomal ceramidase N-terminal domain-containing protein [bacterium]
MRRKFTTFHCIAVSGLAAVLAVLLFLTAGCSQQEVPKVRVGMAETIITPPVGVPMAGYARPDVSKGVHDDLFARSLVIEGADGNTAVLMTLGIINTPRDLLEKIRKGINEQTKIPEDHIVISATHTHSGPDIGGAGDDYKKLLVDRSVESGVTAWKNRVPGRIGTGATVVLELGRNDRRMQYGGLHPDPGTGIIKVEDAKGKLLGVAFNYGCHPSALSLHNLEFTEDWPYYAIKGIKEVVGQNVWVAFYQSAQGDAKVGYSAELSAVGAEMPVRNFWYAEVKGRQMSEAVLKALPSITTAGDPVVKTACKFTDYPLRDSYPITAKEAERLDKQARDTLAEMEKKADTIGKRVLDQYRVNVFLSGLTLGCARWVESHPNPAPLSMEQQAVRIGDTVFVTFPCEVFTEIGLKVKQQSPVNKTFVIGLTSGHGGYIPTADEYLEGGYAAVMTHYSPKCEQVCIDASLDLIGQVGGAEIKKPSDPTR